MTTAVVSYIYPAGLKYLADFLASLASQTVQDFELLLFNDGVEGLEKHLTHYRNKCSIFPAKGSVVEIRFQSFKTLAASGFDAFIFQDIDDSMSANRVEKSRQLLQRYPFVCNDLSLIDASGALLNASTWSARLGDEFEFDHSFIADKNIAGLGNSSLNKSLLQTAIRSHPAAIAADWLMFYQLLFNSGAGAVFTNTCQTIYRQHADNTAGIKEVDGQRLLQVAKVCRLHYESLVQLGYENMQERLTAAIQTEKIIQQHQYHYHSPVSSNNLFWWEEKNYVYEKN